MKGRQLLESLIGAAKGENEGANLSGYFTHWLLRVISNASRKLLAATIKSA